MILDPLPNKTPQANHYLHPPRTMAAPTRHATTPNAPQVIRFMTEQPRPTPGDSCAPSPSQATRIDFARRDLEYARSEDLAQLDAAGLILLVERLRNRLGDVLDIVGEITNTD